MVRNGKANLKRELHAIPAFVLDALERESLMNAYHERPAYQQNDYIGWINSAKRDETKQKRLAQMLAELEQGGVYMRMDHLPSRKS
ncbi:MAG: YdeI/OmpD-associated family protein [Acidobacteriota bacterium]